MKRNKCSQFFLTCFIYLRCIFDLCVDKVFGWYYNRKRKYIEPINNPILLESATSLAKRIRARQLTSEQVVRAFIDRIKQVNPVLNCMIDNRFEDALKEAKAIDHSILYGEFLDGDYENKPFLGVPFTTKESTACAGLSSTFGILARKGRKATEDADIVVSMKKAGAILLGVTNVPPLNLWPETTNRLFGTTKNAYDTARNVGGSSGGEASLLVAGGTPLSIASDSGGSIRIPCFMCGVYGHKPTSDLISLKGLTFRTGKEKNVITVAGTLTRFAEDITPTLKVLLGPNVNKLTLDKSVDVRKIKFYYIVDPKDPWVSHMRTEMKDVMKRTVDYLASVCDTKLKELYLEGVSYSGRFWKYWMSLEDGMDFKNDLTDRNGQVNPKKELLKYITCRSEFEGSVIYNLINELLPTPDTEWVKKETAKLKTEIMDALGDDGVLLYPSAPFPASYHNTAFLRPWNFNYFTMFSILKLPVTQVPLGLGQEGLPVGIQVASAPYNDHLCIAVATQLEKQFGGYVARVRSIDVCQGIANDAFEGVIVERL